MLLICEQHQDHEMRIRKLEESTIRFDERIITLVEQMKSLVDWIKILVGITVTAIVGVIFQAIFVNLR